ncbi:MAG: amino acid adenylation domain-containing protein, partial [Actinobacteria bacterium]|nr:amino acid adenylation domain-containing protein [Actinomycetota bacterium]
MTLAETAETAETVQTARRPLEWAAGPVCPAPTATLPEQIVAAAQRTPDAIAIKQWEAEVTYSELLDAAAGLADTLRAHSVGPETRVGICTRRSKNLPIAVLAVWLAGGAYVSLDPSHPAQRLAGIAEDAGVSVVLVDAAGADLLAGSGQRLVRIDAAAARPAGECVPGARLENAAYVLYTSGSTGRPKGVVVSHGNVAAFAAAVDTLRPMAPGCRSGGFASLGFDASVFELLIPLARGLLVALVPDEDRVDPARLQRFLAEHRVTRTMLPPSVLPLLDPAGLPDLSELFFAGEPCGPEQVERWSGPLPGNDRRHFHNWYGPTETTVIVVATELSGTWTQSLPIGRPLPGCQAYVLDDAMRPCPVGEPGELFIGGPQVTRGYLGQPGHTADRFVPDPYGPRPGGRLYRTGDLVSWQPDGLLAYLGRVDRQVKIHGQRVEAGEVETVLRGMPQVAQAVVDLTVSPGGEQHLVAYLTPSDAPDLTQVREHCSVRLPEYMVPTRVVRLDRLPLNVSGKVDMAALRAVGPQPAAVSSPAPAARDSAAEPTVAGVWAEVFESELPAPDRDFIEAGGHSLLAMRLTSALRDRLGRQVSVEDIWLGRTVAGLTERVAAAPTLVRDVVPSGSTPALSPAQRRMWFVEQLSPGTPEHNITMTEQLTGSLDVAVLRTALRTVAERQDALRWRFPHADGVPRVVVDPPANVPLPVVELADRPLSELLDAEANTPFDIGEGPLWRAKLVRLGPTEHVLMITVHHIVFDGWSWHLLYREISRCYRDGLAGRTETAPLPATFADYVAWLNRLSENQGDALDWWSDRLSGTPQVLDLPRDRPRPTMQGFRGAQADARIDRDTAARLHRVSLAAGGTPFVTLLAAFGELLGRLSGQSELIVGTPLADRRHVAFEPVIGFCLQILPLRVRTDPAASFLEQVRRCGAELAAALAHPDIPLERIVDTLTSQRDLSRNPLIQVMFNMYNFAEPRLTLPGVTAEPLSPGLPGSLYDLTLYVSEQDDEFTLRAVYNPDLYDADRIVALLAGYLQLLDDLLAHPDRHASAASLRPPTAGLPELTDPLPDWSGPGVFERIAAAAERWPDESAVSDADGSLSYADLLAISRATIAAVRSAGVGTGEPVAVVCGRARWLPPVLLGLLGSGARWVLLDPALPAAVLGRQAKAAAPVAVIRSVAAEPIPELSDLPVLPVEQLLA